jgi:hypothetical protein
VGSGGASATGGAGDTGGSGGASGSGVSGGDPGSGGGAATGGAGGEPGDGSAGAAGSSDASMVPADAPSGGGIQTVFIVLEENHDWSQVKSLPYLKHLQQIGAHSEQYYNPKKLHPSEPNYIWLEAGKNFCLALSTPCLNNDADPSASHLVKGATHLTKLLDGAGVSWRSYQEDIAAGTCPVKSGGGFVAKHDPFVFFDDVVGNPPSATNAYCIDHHRPFSDFGADLKAGTVARYNFITPNQDHDMHDGSPEAADTWLRDNIDPIVNPDHPSGNHNAAIYGHAALIVVWDEGASGSDGPIGMLIVSPFAKPGYAETAPAMPYRYTHSSMLLTMQKIFGVAQNPIEDAKNAQDLAEFFTTFP